MLLGAVVQRAGEQPFAEQIRDRIFKPLRMSTTQPDYQWVDIPHRAKGYRLNRNGPATPSTDTDVSWKLPGGGLISNISDLARFGRGFLSNRLLTPESLAAMKQPQIPTSKNNQSYGLGFNVAPFRANEVIYKDAHLPRREYSALAHSGSQEKTATYLLICDEAQTVVAVMCNTQGAPVSRIANTVMTTMLNEQQFQSMRPKRDPVPSQ